MKNKIFQFTVLQISLLFILTCSCTKESERPFARVTTISAEPSDSGGVKLKGEILNFESYDFQDYGFVIVEPEEKLRSSSPKISAGSQPEKSVFTSTVEAGLLPDHIYKAVAYATVKSITTYGNEIRFLSTGSSTPEITEFYPSSGMAGDTIFVGCKNIYGVESDYNLSFNQNNASIIEIKDSIIKAIVPLTLETKLSYICLTGWGKSATFSDPFELLDPVITGFNKTEAYIGDKFIIMGSNFNQRGTLTTVKMNEVQCQILSINTTAIEIRVPIMEETDATVTVTSSGQSTTSTQHFTVKQPEYIDFEPTSATYLDLVALNGHGMLGYGTPEIYFGDIKAKVISSSSDLISVEVPMELKEELTTISLDYGLTKIDFPGNFTLLPPPPVTLYTRKATIGQDIMLIGTLLDPNPSNISVSIGSFEFTPYYYDGLCLIVNVTIDIPLGYHPVSVISSGRIYLSPNDIEIIPSPWEKMADFPGGEVYKTAAFTLDGKGYVGTGTGLEHQYLTQFWKYDPSVNEWTSIGNFPGETRIWANAFSIGQTGFVGGGFDLDAPWRESRYDYYKYDLSEGWSQISNYPYFSDKSYNYWQSTVNDIRYFSTVQGEISYFSAEPEEWNNEQGIPDIIQGASSFVINGKIYIIDNSRTVREYDPESSTWTTKKDFPGEARYFGVGFSSSHKGYYGLGTGNNNYFNDIWEYDPLLDLWIKSAPFKGSARDLPFLFMIDKRVYIGTGYLGGNKCSKDMYSRELPDN